MKNKLFFGAIALLITGLAFSSFDWGAKESVETTNEGTLVAVGTNLYEYTWTKDTIANAANDTLYLPSRMRPVDSDFLMAVSVARTSISGTANIAVKVEGTTYNYTGSTRPSAGWSTALNTANSSAATAATTATEETIILPAAHFRNYRIIVDGTGTQSTSYTIRILMKRKA